VANDRDQAARTKEFPMSKTQDECSPESLCYAVPGRWRVNEAGVFCGTLRIAQFDFDTDPSDEFKAGVYRQMESLLNGETVPNPANNVLEGLGRYYDKIRQ